VTQRPYETITTL